MSTADTHPLIHKAAAEIVGEGRDAGELVSVLLMLLPLLQLCAGPDPAGWLDGAQPRVLPKRVAAEVRESLIRQHLYHHGVAKPVIDRVVVKVKDTPPLEALKLYREAGLVK